MIGIDIVSKLRERLDDHRFNHSIQVAQIAVELARKEGISIEKARIAGLLHDYAKGVGKDKLRNLVIKSSWDVDDDELSLPQLLHAPAGAYLVKKELGIDDMDILEAIRYHTIGRPGMGKLAQIVFIADMVEEGRDFPGITDIRKEVEKGILPGIVKICDHLIKYNIDNGQIIHPNTLLLRNYCLRRID